MLKRFWRRFLAFHRLDLRAVCEMSCGKRDYHDYPDNDPPVPMHFHEMTCRRCGKKFTI